MDALDTSDPRVVAGYQLIGRLGAGGMGRVYLALGPDGGRVALKVILPHLASQAEFRRRFRREVFAAQAVRGPHVAEVVGADPEGDPPWLATRYVPGPSLADAVLRCGPMPAASVAVLATSVADGLLAVERAGLVHRDLKPSNILLDADGPRIIDFGIAKAAEASHLTQTGMVIGTPGFMAPEQIEGAPLTPAADVFSLGAVLVFALTGKGPFGQGTPQALIGRVLFKEPELAEVPEPWREFLRRCLAKEPADRPALATVASAVPAGDPAEPGGLGAGWLAGPVGDYAQEHTQVAAARTEAYLAGGAGRPAPPSPATMLASWPHPTPAGVPGGFHPTPPPHPGPPPRRRRRVWVVGAALSALAVAVAVAVPIGLSQLSGAGDRAEPGDQAGQQPASQPAGADQGDSGEPAAGTLPDAFAGTWTGEVFQEGLGTFPVQITMADGETGGVVGTVRYWTLACSGDLRLDAASDGSVQVTEQIVEGTGNCAQSVPLELVAEADGTLTYLAYPDGDAGSPIEGTLASSPDRLPEAFTGAWEGTVHQDNTDQDYQAVITIDDRRIGAVVGTIEYPSLECAGELRLELVGESFAWFTETIIVNEQLFGCISTGVVALSVPDSGATAYRYFEEPASLSIPLAEGELDRSG